MVDQPGFEFDDRQPRSWADAFPWIPSNAADQAGEKCQWWEWTIDEIDPATRASVIERIASLAIDRLRRWPIGDLLPSLPGNVQLARLNLPVRAMNILDRAQLRTSADIADLPLEDLFGFRNAGIGTVTAILHELIRLSSSHAQVAMLDEEPSVDELRPVDAPSPWVSGLMRDLEALADWNHNLGLSGRSLLSEPPLGSPDAVVQAHKRLLALSADDVLPRSANVVDYLDGAIRGLDRRYQIVLAQRLFAWNPKTLEELGREFGVTRERARQLEVNARSKIYYIVTGDTPAGRVARLVRSQIRGVRPLAELLAEVPSLAGEVAAVGQPAWRVLDVLDDTYEVADGWCAERSFDAARRDTGVLLDELADAYGVVVLADVTLFDKKAGHLPWLKDWLVYLGYEIRGKFILLRTSSLNDIAAAILSIEGAPLSLEELHQKIGRGAPGSLRNQVSNDPMFIKVDRAHYALSEWGMDGYSNIRGEIGKLLDQANGELPLTSVVESLVDRFGVSANSIVLYAGRPPFQVTNGIVGHVTGQLAGRGKNPAKVQRYYLRGEDWLHRITVTFDHLRGSGWPASTALSTILRMAPGDYVKLPSRLGPQSFSYKNHQPAYGSIRRFLEDMNLEIGDEIFLVFKADGTFDVEKLPDVPHDKMAQALRLVGAGISLDVTRAIAALGSAIKFAPDADIVSIAEGFKARREQQIHDLILGIEPD